MKLKKKQTLYERKTVKKTFLSVGRILQLLIFAFLLSQLPPHNVYSIRAVTEEYAPKVDLVPPTPAPYPINVTQVVPPPLSAQGVMIVDVPSGVSLYEKNSDIQFLPASTTKLMTAMVALEHYQLTDEVVVKTVITEGQVMELVYGERITVENLLYGILVHSANDAAFALAEHFPGGVEAYVALMNEKARYLHLNRTHFTNPIGFDDAAHMTTPKDLANLSLTALKNSIITKMVGVPQITVSDSTYSHFHPLKNINELLGKIPGVSGLKTGWTIHAGQALVTTAQRNGRQILIVLLKSEDRFGETEQLLEWVFTNFSWVNYTDSGKLNKSYSVHGGATADT